MLKSNAPPIQHRPLKCELCGKMSEICCMMFLGDWNGLACPECIQQVMDSQERRFISTGERTEPAEYLPEDFMDYKSE